MAVNSTRTEVAMLPVNSRSSTKLGIGTSKTKIMQTAANGTAQSPSPWRTLRIFFDFILDLRPHPLHFFGRAWLPVHGVRPGHGRRQQESQRQLDIDPMELPLPPQPC